MTGIEAGMVMFAIMLALMVVRIPIGVAMFIVGFGGGSRQLCRLG